MFIVLLSKSIWNHLFVETVEGFFIIHKYTQVVKQLWLEHFSHRFWFYNQVWFQIFIDLELLFKPIYSYIRTIGKHLIHHSIIIVYCHFSLCSTYTLYHLILDLVVVIVLLLFWFFVQAYQDGDQWEIMGLLHGLLGTFWSQNMLLDSTWLCYHLWRMCHEKRLIYRCSIYGLFLHVFLLSRIS